LHHAAGIDPEFSAMNASGAAVSPVRSAAGLSSGPVGSMTALRMTTLAALFMAGWPVGAMGDARHDLAAKLQAVADAYLAERAEKEMISAVSVSVSLPADQAPLNVVAGRVSREPGAAPATPDSLFQIGSITKSFTSVTVLQLQAAGRLSIDQTVGDWLPQYPAWRDVTIRRLLDMTSDIPGYDNVDAMLTAEGESGGMRRWSDPVLVGFADPTYPGAPKPTTGWDYSNTNYILAGMIIEKATGRSYASEIQARFLGDRLGLSSTYYSPDIYPAQIRSRMVSGYFANTEPSNVKLKPLVGKDMKDNDMSWAAAAGGIVSRPQDVAAWARALYAGPLLSAKERAQLMTIVSNKTGQPIAEASEADPVGFGLGVGAAYKAAYGHVWYYQGETLGYRMFYGYFPKDDLVIAFGLNSQPNDPDNKAGELLERLYTAIKG
jgi:D-alanyl-D-alanine carboxypeptidase